MIYKKEEDIYWPKEELLGMDFLGTENKKIPYAGFINFIPKRIPDINKLQGLSSEELMKEYDKPEYNECNKEHCQAKDVAKNIEFLANLGYEEIVVGCNNAGFAGLPCLECEDLAPALQAAAKYNVKLFREYDGGITGKIPTYVSK